MTEKHPQDVNVLQHQMWVTVWEAARRHDDFRDFHKLVREATLSLRWTEEKADTPEVAAPEPDYQAGILSKGGLSVHARRGSSTWTLCQRNAGAGWLERHGSQPTCKACRIAVGLPWPMPEKP